MAVQIEPKTAIIKNLGGMMNLKSGKLILLVLVLAVFVFIPFSYSEEEDFISVSPVEKQDNSQALESGSVTKVETVVPAKVVEKVAEKPAPAAVVSKGNKVENILPLDLKDKTEIRIITSSPVKYKATELAAPPNPRILVQLIDCEVKGDTKEINNSNVGKIRSAPHSTTAWVVIDLKDKQKWEISASGSTIIVNVPKGSAQPRTQEKSEVTAPVAKPGSLIYRVIDVAGKNLPKKTRVIITTDGPVKYRVKKDTAGKFINISIVDAVSIWQKDSIDMTEGPVNRIALSENTTSKEVNVRLNMAENNPYTVTRDQNQIVIDIDKSADSTKKIKRHLDLYQKISINIQDASLNGVLRLLSTQTGFEFSTSPSTVAAAPVTIREDDQTLDRVLKDILIPQNLYYELGDGIIKIGSVNELKTAKSLRLKVTRFYSSRNMEAKNIQPLLDAALAKEPLMDVITKIDTSGGSNRLMLVGSRDDVDNAFNIIAAIDSDGSDVTGGDSDGEGNGRLRTKVFKLENVRFQMEAGNAMEDNFLGELRTTIQNLLSPDGKFSLDRRTSSIIVTETVANLKKIEKVIKSLDERVPQVSIEAKLYEVSVGAQKDLGVSWQVRDQNKEPYIDGDVLAGSVGSGSTGGSLNVGSVLNGFKIDATIRALESKNKATLLSAPKVAVENNQPATIRTERNVYYQVQEIIPSTTGAPVVTTRYDSLSLPIELKVFCKSSKDGYINMRVDVKVAKIVTTSRLTGPPDTSIQTASTYIKAKNNETIVIGGLINENISDVEEKVPLLGDLPLIGGLFRGSKKVTEKVELVVFLTPSIVEE